jgi:hypothetical protein
MKSDTDHSRDFEATIRFLVDNNTYGFWYIVDPKSAAMQAATEWLKNGACAGCTEGCMAELLTPTFCDGLMMLAPENYHKPLKERANNHGGSEWIDKNDLLHELTGEFRFDSFAQERAKLCPDSGMPLMDAFKLVFHAVPAVTCLCPSQ